MKQRITFIFLSLVLVASFPSCILASKFIDSTVGEMMDDDLPPEKPAPTMEEIEAENRRLDSEGCR